MYKYSTLSHLFLASEIFMLIRQLSALVLFLASAAASGEPAPWYWWVSQRDGQRVCAQTMPSQGWVRAQGPFNNAQCLPQQVAPPLR